MEETGEQLENSKVPKQLQPYMYKKGQSGNISGRPLGISLKEYARMKFRQMSDDEKEEFLEGINKIEIFKMAEGNPKQDVDTKVEGELTIQISEKIAQKLNDSTQDTEPSSGIN
jgi:hypothetical protein